MNNQQPRYGMVSGPEYEEQLFKEKFTNMAFAALEAKFADIMSSVVTFKIIEITPESGSGVGVFIVNLNNKPIYIPVILVDSQLKPIEILYYKELNMFLPLELPWLDEITKMSLSEMGEGSTIPPMVPRDVDIENIVLPPQVNIGRYGYASCNESISKEAKEVWDKYASVFMTEAEKQETLPSQDLFLQTLTIAPKEALDGIKLAFETNVELLNKLAETYTLSSIVDAMNEGYNNNYKQEKIASTEMGTVDVLTKEASAEEFQNVFGSDKSIAYQTMLNDGLVIRDTRSHIEKVAVKIEKPTFLSAPGPEPSWCKLYFTEGKPDNYLVIPFPKDGCDSSLRLVDDYHHTNRRQPTPYVVISADCKEAWRTEDLLGEILHNPVDVVGNSKLYKLINSEQKGTAPTKGSYGVFINVTPDGHIECTDVTEIDQVITDGEVTKYCANGSYTKYIIDQDPSRKRIQHVTQADSYFMPKDTKFVEIIKIKDTENRWNELNECRSKRKESIIKDPKLLLRWMNNILQESGAQQPLVKSAGLNQFWVPGFDYPISRSNAIEKIATLYNISVDDTQTILDNACSLGKSDIYIVNADAFNPIKTALHKYAQAMPVENPGAYQSTPGQQEGLPPVDGAQMSPPVGMELPPGMSMDPMAMSGITPTDLAIGEAVDGLQQQIMMQQQDTEAQMAQLEQQAALQTQANQQLVETLQGIQERSQQITQATGGAIPPQAMESPAVAANTLAPVPPPEEAPAPMPMMDQESNSPEMIAQQINPYMIDQAQEFNDAGLFDTAAISMLANTPILQDIVATYIPNLEKAIDNLGRILITLWLKEQETKEEIGDEAFTSIEDKLRNVFKGLGDIVLTLSHNAMSTPDEQSNMKMMMQS